MNKNSNSINTFLFLIILIYAPLFISATASENSQIAFQEGLTNAAYYETPRGHHLRYTQFISPIEGPKDTVLLIQGRSTFLEFYETLIVPLLDRGLNVWMYDLSGQGGSTRLVEPESHDEETIQQMQHVDSFDLYVEDARDFIHEVVEPNSDGRLILGGYSTGAHIALRVLQHPSNIPFDSAFMISPLLALNAPIGNKPLSYVFWCASLFMGLDNYRPEAGPVDPIFTASYEGNVYTSDRAGYRELQALCIQYQPFVMGGVSLGWIKAALDSLELLWKNKAIRIIQVPVLIATGGEDTMIDIRYNAEFARRLRHSKHAYYPKARHEIFRETPEIRAQWWADFDEFFSITGG